MTQPMPWMKPPMTCPRSTPGLIERPMSISKSTRGTRQLAGEAIDLDFGDRRALRVVEKRIAAAGLAIEIDARRGVETAGAEIDAVPAGRVAELAESAIAAAGLRLSNTSPSRTRRSRPTRSSPISSARKPPGGELGQPRFDLPARFDRRRAVQIGAGRGGGRRRVGDSFPSTSASRSRGPTAMPNSSATSWRIFMFSPWPISVPPVETCTVPSV